MHKGVAAVLIVVFALGMGLSSPARVQAGAADAEKAKIVELLKLQLLLSRGEHGQFHDALEKLSKKYPNDLDVKTLSDQYHETMHKRMTAGEQATDLLMKGYLSGGGD
ncbi:MAG: hypothetical protein HYZ81_27275 [Nitrospinae bacterium]|nr:hypothetical protein [Nitrospinota bacterium]